MFSTVILAHFDAKYNALQLIREIGAWNLIAFHNLEVSAQLQTISAWWLLIRAAVFCKFCFQGKELITIKTPKIKHKKEAEVTTWIWKPFSYNGRLQIFSP